MLRRHVLPGLLKSHAAHCSSVTTAEGCNLHTQYDICLASLMYCRKGQDQFTLLSDHSGSLLRRQPGADVLRIWIIIAAVRWVFISFTVIHAPKLPTAHCILQHHVATMHSGSMQTWGEDNHLFVRMMLGYIAATSRWYIRGHSSLLGTSLRDSSWALISSRTSS